MASPISTMHASTRQYVKTGLGGAGNFRSVKSTPSYSQTSQASIRSSTPTIFMTGIGGAGNMHSASEKPTVTPEEARARDRVVRDNSPNLWHFGIGGAGNSVHRDGSPSSASSSSTLSSPTSTSTTSTASSFGKLKARLQSSVEARNSRVSLFEAWQRKLPTYSNEKERRVNRMSSSSSYSSDAETQASKIGDLKGRIGWRFDRIMALGLDDGLESLKPVYTKLEI